MGWFLPALSILGMAGQSESSSEQQASQQFGSTILQGQQAVQEGAKRDKIWITLAVIVVVVLVLVFAFRNSS